MSNLPKPEIPTAQDIATYHEIVARRAAYLQDQDRPSFSLVALALRVRDTLALLFL